ncbi:MAG TPA: ABC transporter substrate-binding protein, partial [Phycisphaerae bacterium]|nr:ABC transporter substrate-binding protein [Phycisphaerae bacterium]
MVLASGNYTPCPREAVDYWLAGGGEIPMDERNVEFTDKKMIVGTGAYLLKEWERKKKIVLVRNPDYRLELYPSSGDETARKLGLLKDAGKRLPIIDMCHYDYVPEFYTSWMLFLTGRSDASGIPQEAYASFITPDMKLSKKWEKDQQIYLRMAWTPTIYWLTFNMNDKVIGASKSLRQAMCLCFDIKSYLKVLFNDRGRRARSIVPENFEGFVPGPYFRLDMKLAMEKIALAKEELRAKGLLDENGQIPQITIDSDDHIINKRIGNFAMQQFAKIGVRIKLQMMDWPTLQERVQTKKSQMYMMGWVSDYYDAENFLQLFYSPNITAGTNGANYSNPQFDRLYEKIRVMPDSPQRTELYKKMVQMVCEDCPVLPLTEPLTLVLLHDWYENYRMMPIGAGYGKFRNTNVELRKKFGGRR